MRAFLATLLLCVLVFPAHAGWLIPSAGNDASAHYVAHTHQAASEGWRDRRVIARNHETGFAVSVLSAACRIARSLGGPCGCFASEQVFGHSVRELWLADAWLKFPRTLPHSGAVAVWPHRHVAPVIAVNGDGTVTVRDSWAVRRVRVAGLVFVDPRAGLPPMRTRRAGA
jgi:hypothetical protein